MVWINPVRIEEHNMAISLNHGEKYRSWLSFSQIIPYLPAGTCWSLMKSFVLTFFNVFQDVGALQGFLILVYHENPIFQIFRFNDYGLAFLWWFNHIIWYPPALFVLMHPELLLDSPSLYLFFSQVEKRIGTRFDAKANRGYIFQLDKFAFSLFKNLEKDLWCPQVFTPLGSDVFLFLCIKTFIPQLGLPFGKYS